MGSFAPEPTEEQLDDALNTAYENKDEMGSKWPGMSYEDGVIATIEWVKGDRAEHPFEEN